MNRRPYGYLPDPPLAPRVGGGGILRIVDAPPTKYDALLPLLGEVFDQGSTSSCVAQAAAKCVEVSTRLAGFPMRPSRRGIYAMGRVRGGDIAFRLSDLGTIPSAAVTAMDDWGVLPESEWPWSENVNEALPWNLIQLATSVRVTGWEKLDPTKDSVKHALSSGYPVMFAMPVDEAYEGYAGGVYQGPKGPELGGHMQTLVGYDGEVMNVLNSWGAGWGESGRSRIASSFVFGGACTDFYALEALPKELACARR